MSQFKDLYRFYNTKKIILSLFKKPLLNYLNSIDVPRQTIGIFMNPITKNRERLDIVKKFRRSNDEKRNAGT